MLNNLASEEIAILASIDPVSQTAATVNTGWLPASDFHRFLVTLDVGVMATGSTIDAKLRQATSASGTNVKDITGKAITQLTQAGGNGNQQIMLNLSGDELDVNGGFAYFTLSITVGTAASLICAQILGVNPKITVASVSNQNGVVQVVP
ncbi:MAG: hypothetical protein HQL73_02795 [Magnetococcales bacterium]|nr:hypothetical protein [Magnetococcales bacterium]